MQLGCVCPVACNLEFDVQIGVGTWCDANRVLAEVDMSCWHMLTQVAVKLGVDGSGLCIGCIIGAAI